MNEREDPCPGISLQRFLATKDKPRKSLTHRTLRHAPGGTRTHDIRIRNPMLCPTELPAQIALLEAPRGFFEARKPGNPIVCLDCVPLSCMGGPR